MCRRQRDSKFWGTLGVRFGGIAEIHLRQQYLGALCGTQRSSTSLFFFLSLSLSLLQIPVLLFCSVRRVWLPNVQSRHLWSAILNRPVVINVTTHALKAMDRVGGLDRYLLETSEKELASETGVILKRMLEKRLRRSDRSDTPLSAGTAAVSVSNTVNKGPQHLA